MQTQPQSDEQVGSLQCMSNLSNVQKIDEIHDKKYTANILNPDETISAEKGGLK